MTYPVLNTSVHYDAERDVALISWRGSMTAQAVIDGYQQLLDIPGCSDATDRISDFTGVADFGTHTPDEIQKMVTHYRTEAPASFETASYVAMVSANPLQRVWAEFWAEWTRRNTSRIVTVCETREDAYAWIAQSRAEAGEPV